MHRRVRSDRAGVDARPEVVTFTTAPLASSVTLAGRVAATVRFRTHAVSCGPSLRAFPCPLKRDGLLPLAEGYTTVSDAAIGETYVPMRATCATVTPGEALRLSIAGACFPAFPINPGNGARPCDSRTIDARPIANRNSARSRLEPYCICPSSKAGFEWCATGCCALTA